MVEKFTIRHVMISGDHPEHPIHELTIDVDESIDGFYALRRVTAKLVEMSNKIAVNAMLDYRQSHTPDETLKWIISQHMDREFLKLPDEIRARVLD